MIQAYVDESGGLGHSRLFVFAALVAPSNSWEAFSREWRACLEAPPSISQFKMSDAENRNNEFFKWDRNVRDNKVRDLSRIACKYVDIAHLTVYDLHAHADIIRQQERIRKPISSFYFQAYFHAIVSIAIDLYNREHKEPFEIIFDEQVIHGPRAKRYYPLMKYIIGIRAPEKAAILPVEPLFKRDDDCMPLQAADMFAGPVRRKILEERPKECDWVCEELLGTVGLSPYTRVVNRDGMMKQVTEGNSFTDEELLAAYREYRRMFRASDT